jgi:hypothetical protein
MFKFVQFIDFLHANVDGRHLEGYYHLHWLRGSTKDALELIIYDLRLMETPEWNAN